MNSILEREITEIVNIRARHAIAIQLATLRRVRRLYRKEMREIAETGNFYRMQNLLDRAAFNRHSALSLWNHAKTTYSRVHPAPGKLPWCLVNTHGPVCDNRAEPGSDFCRAHAHYGDIQDWRRP